MPASKSLEVRAARDRVIDLLGLGKTYPLQNVEVQSPQIKVAYNETATIHIEPGQNDVRYELREQNGTALQPPYSVIGADTPATLTTPNITVDTTYLIRAVKSEDSAPPELIADLSVDLSQKVTVTVGIHVDRKAWISSSNVERLYPNRTPYENTDPRITAHGNSVEVTIKNAQAGVSYQLEYAIPGRSPITTQWARGRGQNLTLSTGPMTEDTEIQIGASLTSAVGAGAEGAVLAEVMLTARLPLAVRANPELTVSVVPSGDGTQLFSSGSSVKLTIAGSQKSVTYSAYARPLRDDDFVGAPASPEDIIVHIPPSLGVARPDVLVRAPHRPGPWTPPDGYQQIGGPTAGNGGNLTLTLAALHEDSVIVIQAHKLHVTTGLAATGKEKKGASSALQLEQAAVVLLRPKVVPLKLTLSCKAGAESGTLLVSGGQRGVFYHFHLAPDGEAVCQPAYFHRMDEDDPYTWRGIDHLEIAKDMVVTRTPPRGAAKPVAAALEEPDEPRFPPDPLIDVAPLPPAKVRVMAVQARTGAAWSAWSAIPVTTVITRAER